MSYFWKQGKIELRGFEEADQEALYQMLLDTEGRVNCDFGYGLPYGQMDAQLFIEYAKELAMLEQAICLAIIVEDNLVGYVNLSQINMRMGHAVLLVYVDRKWRKMGVARSACQVMLHYAFDEMRLHKVKCSFAELADSPHEFVEKLGFLPEACECDALYIDGSYVNKRTFSMTKQQHDKICSEEEVKSGTCYNDGEKAEDARALSEEEYTGISGEETDYWSIGEIRLRPLLEEECAVNHEILFESDEYHFYENTVGLPYFSEEPDGNEMDCLSMDVLAERIIFAIEDCSGEYVGNVQFHSIDRRHGSFSYSFYVREKYRGKGYATAALRKVISYAFCEMRLHKCMGSYNEGNEASKRVMEKLGLKLEGVKREELYYDGKYMDVYQMGITAEDWK